MKSILKATAMLGSASLINIAAGLVSSKVSAVVLGPAGVGYVGLLQASITLSITVAGLGVTVGMIRAGAKAVADGDAAKLAAIERAAARILLAGALACACLIVLFRRPLAGWVLGSETHAAAAAAMAIGVLLTMAASYGAGRLNLHHRVADLARMGVLSSLSGAAASISLILFLGERGIVPAVLAPPLLNWIITAHYCRTRLPRSDLAPAGGATRDEARALLAFGLPYTLSMMLGAGVLYAMPVLVLNQLGTTETGYYRASSALAVTYLGFLLAALQQDYNPRVSVVQDDAAALQRLINDQLKLVLLLGGPLILAMLALAPFLIRIVYSPAFAPAVDVLEWQLIGDLPKFASWTMSFVIVARLGSAAFLRTELAGGAMLLGSSLLLTSWLGLEGLGMAFLATSSIYCLICLFTLRSSFPLTWTRSNVALFAALAAAMLLVRALTFVGLEDVRTPVALLLAVGFGVFSLVRLEREVEGRAQLRARLARFRPRGWPRFSRKGSE